MRLQDIVNTRSKNWLPKLLAIVFTFTLVTFFVSVLFLKILKNVDVPEQEKRSQVRKVAEPEDDDNDDNNLMREVEPEPVTRVPTENAPVTEKSPFRPVDLPILMQPATRMFRFHKFGMDRYGALFSLESCPELHTQCRIIYSVKQAINAAVKVFFSFDYVHNIKHWKKLQKERDNDHFYVFFALEPPENMPDLSKEIPNFFNMTMTYYPDSDVFVPYGWVLNKDRNQVTRNFTYSHRRCSTYDPEEDLEELFENKTRTIMSIVSNCAADSGRTKLINSLNQYIYVESFGKCSQPVANYHADCAYAPGENVGEDAFERCLKHMEQDFFFYFSLENSVCAHYVTEKLYQVVRYNIVPVVMKRALAEEHFPKDAFIAADDYMNVRGLATALIRISNNKQLYLSYFRWKNCYKTILNVFHAPKFRKTESSLVSACDLCRAVLRRREKHMHKWYPSMEEWYMMSGKACEHKFFERNLERRI